MIGVPDEKWGEAVHAVVVLHARRRRHRGGHPRLVQGQDRRLQAAEVGLVHRRGRHAENRHRQDPAPRSARQVRRRSDAQNAEGRAQ